jgi:hypothetical protein
MLQLVSGTEFLTAAVFLLLFKTQNFGDWIISLSSGKTYSVGPDQ